MERAQQVEIGKSNASGNLPIMKLLDNGSDIGYVFNVNTQSGMATINATRLLTPSAGSHVYSIQAQESGGTGVLVKAGAGGAGNFLPAYIRVTREI